MAATVTAFIFYNKFKEQVGAGAVNLGAATTFYAQLLTSASNCTDQAISTLSSVTGTATGDNGQKVLANNVWTALSAAPSSTQVWDWDAVVFTASTNTWTVKFCQVYMSIGVGTGLPIGYWQLVAADTEVTDGNTVTVTPNTNVFSMSG